MTVASCPSCKESVTVPVDATPESVVRCPLCHEEFTLEAFLEQLPPKLIVLDAGVNDTAAEPATTPEVEPDASSSNVLGAFATGEASGESQVSSDSVPAFDFTPGSVSKDEQETTSPAPRRRPQKNPTIEVIKIVAGALLAIPLAQIVLWWLVPSGWQRDLFRLGPAVSRVVPWVVPEKYRANDGDDEMETAPPAVQQRSAHTTSGRSRAQSRPGNGSATPAAGSARSQPGQPDVPAGTSDRLKANQPVQDAGPTQPAAKETPPERKDATNEVLVRGVRNAPQYSPSEFRAALEAALQASIAWDAETDLSPQRRSVLDQQFYEAFAKLSEAVTYPPPDDPETGDLVVALRGVMQSFAKKPSKLAMIGNQSSAWLDQPSRSTEGILLFGTVKQIHASGELFFTQMELASLKQRTVTVVSRVDPRVTFKPGDRILMLGAIVEQPAENMLGYEGQEPMVVMGGFPVVIR